MKSGVDSRHIQNFQIKNNQRYIYIEYIVLPSFDDSIKIQNGGHDDTGKFSS